MQIKLYVGCVTMNNYEILWKKTLDELSKTVSQITIDTFLSKVSVSEVIGSTLILKTGSKMFATNIKKFSKEINNAFESAKTGLTDFSIYLENSTEPFFSSAKNEIEDLSSPIDPKNTFENFVVGTSNRYLYAAAKAVADDPGNSYNPLFIYGGTGLGKTHVMQAIANEIKHTYPKLNVLYVTCEKFTNDLINTIRQGKAYSSHVQDNEDFRKRYRSVDVFLVDDVQFLAKKQSTQEEFFHTFNELYSQNKQIVLSADCLPNEIDLLSERLQTRFQSGLTAQVLEPDIETKIAIAQKKAEGLKCLLPIDVATFIAEKSGSSVRSLEGLLNTVRFAALLKESPITLEIAMQALNQSTKTEETQEALTPGKIIDAVCSFYKVAKTDLLGKKKNKEIVEPRQICAYLITDLLSSLPLVAVGKELGDRDYTTIIHARNKISELIRHNEKLATEINDLKNLILKK